MEIHLRNMEIEREEWELVEKGGQSRTSATDGDHWGSEWEPVQWENKENNL